MSAVQGSLLDVYARADITALCRSNAYNRLQWEDVTVGQALALGVRVRSGTLSDTHPHSPQPRPSAVTARCQQACPPREAVT